MSRDRIESIFHPSDFSRASEIAFEHALKLALATGSRFDILHVEKDRAADWSDFPGVRATLERWRLLPQGSQRSAVAGLGIEVSKALSSRARPVKACLDFLKDHPADLIVLAVHQRHGRMSWLDERVGEPIARRAGEMTLFIPQGVPGFVSHENGSVSLRSVLIPIATEPSAQPALDAAARMFRGLGLPSGTLHLLHVGVEAPRLVVPAAFGWSVSRVLKEDGDPVEIILQTAETVGADLIMMTTAGRHGFLDALRGSTSERVLRGARCPLLSLPATDS